MQSVGTRLREARIKKGYTLEDINARTRISLKNLNAIESDDLSKISSPFTYRSFVKQVADTLGVDFATLAPDVQAASSTMPEPLVPGQEEEVFVRPHQFQQVKAETQPGVGCPAVSPLRSRCGHFQFISSGEMAVCKPPNSRPSLCRPAAASWLRRIVSRANPSATAQIASSPTSRRL